jgi:hypothetical protein
MIQIHTNQSSARAAIFWRCLLPLVTRHPSLAGKFNIRWLLVVFGGFKLPGAISKPDGRPAESP